MASLREITCVECGAVQPNEIMGEGCKTCGSAWLDASYAYADVATVWNRGLQHRPQSLWRYHELLPVSGPDPEISLGEGFTPLLRAYQLERLYAAQGEIYVKDERQGPTSSFKDRQAAVAVTAMRKAGIRECVLASTGNAAAAYAAYCARAGIRLWLFMASQVPAEKMREAALYGAEVVRVSGTYDDTKRVAAEFAARKGIHFDRGAKSIAGKESMKTLAFEIAEQLGLQRSDDAGAAAWQCPDWYVQAVSGGIGPLGVWKGFTELHQMGLIDRLPRLAIVQVAGCAPMSQAFQANKASADPVVPTTLIHVLATGDPGPAYGLLREAVLKTGGTMFSVTDGEAFEAMRRTASRIGLSVEPATAVAFAGLERMFTEGMVAPGETVVVNCSGHTFPAESHVLGDQYTLSVELGHATAQTGGDGLSSAFNNLDEQITSILVVDDNPNDRRLIRRLLRAYKQYRVIEAQSGADALAKARDQRPDLIITDLTMPVMDGFTLLERVKGDPELAHIPVVVVSAKSLTDADRALLSRYSDSVWTKGSFETGQLAAHIASTLGDSGQADARPVSTDEPAWVLVIDDEPRDRRLLRRMIESSGDYHIVEANDSRSGLKLAYEHRPDLMIVDVNLPDINGRELIETIRADHLLRDVPLMVYTAEELTPEQVNFLSQHTQAILQKTRDDKQVFVTELRRVLS